MARRRPIQISTPGRIPNEKIGCDVPAGQAINPLTTTFTCTAIPQLTCENPLVNVIPEFVRGVEYPAGAVLTFDIVCAAGAELRPETNPAKLLIRIPTTAVDFQDLTYEKDVEIYSGIPLE